MALVCASATATAATAPVPLGWSTPAAIDAVPPFSDPEEVGGVSCASAAFCAVTTEHAVLTSTNPLGGFASWRRTPLGEQRSLRAVSCPTESACVAVGHGAILASADPTGGPTRWTFAPLPGDALTLDFVACPTTALCLAGGLGGDFAMSTDPFGSRRTWSGGYESRNVSGLACLRGTTLCGMTQKGVLSVTDDPVDGEWHGGPEDAFVWGFACASPTFCITAADNGRVATSTDPTGGPEAWTVVEPGGFEYPIECAPPSLCLGFAGDTLFSATDPTEGAAAWSRSSLPSVEGDWPHDASCPSQLLCVITMREGFVGVSANPTGGADAWAITQLAGTNALQSVACADASSCVAFDSVGRALMTDDPLNGAASWTRPRTVDAGSTVRDAACPSRSLCVGVEADGGIVVSTDPSDAANPWTRTGPALGAALTSVACPSTGLCVAVDTAGNAIATTDPTGNPDAWHATPITTTALTGIACPTTTLCVAVDTAGNAIATTDPTGNPDAWHATPIAGVSQLTAVSCRAPTLCVAVGGDAAAMSTDPSGGAWTATVVDAAAPLTDVACPSTDLCVAVDAKANVLVGTSPPPPRDPTPPIVELPRDGDPLDIGGPTAEQLRALLRDALGRLGRSARIGPLLRRGRCAVALDVRSNGIVSIRWHRTRGRGSARASGGRPILVARGGHTFAQPGKARVVVRLTPAGRRLLRSARRIALTARGTFAGAQRVSVRTRIVLRR